MRISGHFGRHGRGVARRRRRHPTTESSNQWKGTRSSSEAEAIAFRVPCTTVRPFVVVGVEVGWPCPELPGNCYTHPAADRGRSGVPCAGNGPAEQIGRC